MRSSRSQKKSKAGLGRPQRPSSQGGPSHPPPVNPQIKQTFRLRFTCTTAANSKVITWVNLLDTVNFATAAAVAYDVYDNIRIKRVEVWAAPAQGSAPTPVRVQFGGVNGAPAGSGRVFSDTSMGVQPAHVVAIPEKLSTDAMWQISNGYTAFLLTCPIGAVIDLVVAMKVDQAIAPLATQNVPVAATPGQIYFRGLDGLAAAGTTLPADAPLTD